MLCGRIIPANLTMAVAKLIPESQLVFSPELAATVGLEEAVLLQQIRGLYLHQPATQRDGLRWLHVSRAYLLQLLPFWSSADLDRLCRSLENLGLIRLDGRTSASESLLLAINEADAAEPTHDTRPGTSASPAAATQGKAASAPAKPFKPRAGGGEPLPTEFQPSEDMLELLERFHGVPRGFALEQLEDFTLYWRERGSAGHAWQNKFKQHVQFQWARQQQHTGPENAGQRGIDGPRRTRDSSLQHDLTDTSWAD